jgi:predicted PurR-regulated permease PerM
MIRSSALIAAIVCGIRRCQNYGQGVETPAWLRTVGFSAWLLVGIGILAVGLVTIAALTATIVLPLLTATIISAVASPIVAWAHGKGVPRAVGALLVMLGLVAIGVLVVYTVIAGITTETSHISGHLDGAKSTIAGWLKDLGVDPGKAKSTTDDAGKSLSSGISALLSGLSAGIKAISSLAIFLAFTTLSLFFLLKDGPAIRSWIEGHLGLQEDVTRIVTSRMLGALRGYFLGVTIVAVFNAVLVGAGALILGVPLAGTIALVTFFGAYIPYIGAWTAGAFSVLLALGGAGTDAAAGMVFIQLLSNGPLQQLVQPLAMGAALGIHPLAVLVVTIAGGCLFGAAGLVLAAPVTAAIVQISGDLRGRAAQGARGEGTPPGRPAPTAGPA